MTEQARPTISIITATYNAAKTLPRLIESLAAQTDQDFEWMVADGASTDATLGILEEAKAQLKKVVIDSREDFGIYDALNRAINQCTGEYYVVIGADDYFFPETIEKFKFFCAENRVDLASSYVLNGDGEAKGVRSRPWEWLYGPFAYVSGHAVSLAIRKSLHNKLGFYSRKFPIAADQLFILKAIRAGASVAQAQFVAGRFEAVGGTSGQDVCGTLLESYRVQIEMGKSYWVQTAVLFLRLIKNRNRLR